MKANAIINSLKARGIYLLWRKDKILCRAPQGAITKDVRERIKNNKKQILKLLENRNPYNLPVVAPVCSLTSRVFHQLLRIIRLVMLFINIEVSKLRLRKSSLYQPRSAPTSTRGAMTTLINGDCNQVLDQMPANSVDSMTADGPYGYAFMGKDWDKTLTPVATWKKCYRVMKSGSISFIFCAPRQDVLSRTIINLENAGFEIAFSPIFWTYATGFPKAHNISNALRKKGYPLEAMELEGAYAGFQPKPAVEVIIVAMKPLKEKSYTAQALSNGKGATWLDDCRIPYGNEVPNIGNRHKHGCGDGYGFKPQWEAKGGVKWSPEKEWKQEIERQAHEKGRFPANLLVSDNVLDDGKEHVAGTFPARRGQTEYFGLNEKKDANPRRLNDSGGYSRFFSLDAWTERNLPFLIIPKASKKEKNAGLKKIKPTVTTDGRKKSIDNPFQRGKSERHNSHPTVKPIELMAYLITMCSRPGDVVLDPFMGTGTTCIAANMLGRKSIGIERNQEYFEIASARVRYAHLKKYHNETPQQGSGSSESKKKPRAKTKSDKAGSEKKGGFRDWTAPNNNVNICTGCENDCLYCYAKSMAYRFKQVELGHWHEVKIRQHDVEKNRKLHNGLVGFPSSHDITPSNIDAYLHVLGKLLHAGNDVLIVSKPRINCIKQICDASQAFKDKVLFRFTIGAMNNEILKFWEPNAPSYQERKECLEYAFKEGFRTSVSMEPMLDTDNINSLIEDLDPSVAGDIWLGTMNHLNRIRKNADKRLTNEIELIEFGQTAEKLAAIHDLFKDNPKIKWKAEAWKIINKANANKYKSWERVPITTSNGDKKEIAAPVIISATRRSDIPAWYSQWFMDGLRNGHIKYQLRGNWYNVSFENARCIVFWTKNPKPMIKHLDEIDQMGIGYYFTHTLNNYEEEGLEPVLPALDNRIDTFQELSGKIGKEKVIWRFDPLILADKISKELLIERVGFLMEHLAGYTEKIVFSFLDPKKYNAKNKLKRIGIEAKSFSSDDKRFVAKHIATLAEKHNIQAATCSEGMNLLSYGIIPNKCIDGELIRKAFSKDRELMKFIELNGLEHHVQGQNCGCIQSYDVGIENTCKNGCAYCYANASKKAIESNLRRISNYGIKM